MILEEKIPESESMQYHLFLGLQIRVHSLSIHLKEGLGLNKCPHLKGGRVCRKVNSHLEP